ncbi:MAG: hypothetical protein FD149_2563 [Rhodospirillaceae bacterium]|nr:MAG: hypothetical protein FD149_2563 [Rhodospirillaceae bacterium]
MVNILRLLKRGTDSIYRDDSMRPMRDWVGMLTIYQFSAMGC